MSQINLESFAPAMIENRQNSYLGYQCRLLKSETEIIEYERALYREFTRKNPHNWLCRNYLLIDGDRYRASIPYSNQSIYGIYRGTELISAVAIGFNTGCQMQFEAVGFSLEPELTNCNYCEVLTFFIAQDKHHNYFQIIKHLKQVVITDLKARNIAFGLANCTKNLLPLYLRMGWNIIEQKTLEKKTKYLIKFGIE
ncbi:hypothetical protein IQ255_28890 [Pleurocapsales cyanobacterium LEGE 10410]|nr:hypothetical protein [Pleurocapsales cyanobacterium LEGE 10410]